MRFSLLTLIATTTFAGLACAALAKPSAEWLSLIVTAVSVTWAVQLLRVLLQTGPRRAAAAGWLLFATTYVALVLGPWMGEHVGPSLATTHAIRVAQAKWHPDEQRINVNNIWTDIAPYTLQSISGATVTVNTNTSYALLQNLLSAGSPPPPSFDASGGLFQLTAQWLFAWLAGCLGAALAATFQRRAAAMARARTA